MPKTAAAPAAKKSTGSLGAIDLSGFGAPKAKTGKTAYPVHPDPKGEVKEIVPILLQETQEFDALKGSLDIHKAELAALALPVYFETNRNRIEIPSSIACHGPAGASEEVLVTFTSKFKETTDQAAIESVLGDRTPELVRPSFVIKIDGDLLPPDPATRQRLVNDLQTLFNSAGATAALSAKSVLKPVPEFHAKRHTLFTPEENQQIHMALPMVIQVKTKGRK